MILRTDRAAIGIGIDIEKAWIHELVDIGGVRQNCLLIAYRE